MKVFSPLDIEHVKIAASRLRKDLPNRKHTELLHIAAHAFYGVANFHELQRRVVSQLPTPERFQRKIPTLHDAVSESASSVSQLNAWVGSDYDAGGRLLILLESTWGGGTQKEDVLSWAAGGLDATFSRMYRVLAAPGEGRLDFFNRFACMVALCLSVRKRQKQTPGITVLPANNADKQSLCSRMNLVGRWRSRTMAVS